MTKELSIQGSIRNEYNNLGGGITNENSHLTTAA